MIIYTYKNMVDIVGVDEFTARVITATESFVKPFYLTYTGISGTYPMTSSDFLIVCDTVLNTIPY